MELLMDVKLNEVETDFIEFMAARRNKPAAELEEVFRRTKARFGFSGPDYAKLTGQIPRLYRIMFDTTTAEETVKCYRAHELLHLFAYLSYTYPKPKSSLLRDFRRDLKKGEWRNMHNFLKRKLSRGKKQTGVHLGPPGVAQFLIDSIDGPPVVVDYGSGLAYVSYEIAQANREAKIFLVDIDCLVLEFAEFRLKKIGADVQTIAVTETNLHPVLPEHNICIASEVMEHIDQPLVAYENICHAMQAGGILYGGFEDHQPNMFHISPDLGRLRERISQDFEKLNHRCYRKLR